MVRNYKRKTVDRFTKDDLLAALLCIKDTNLTICQVSKKYGISRTTLYRQYEKFRLAGCKWDDVNQLRTCGGNPVLTKVEEDVFEKTIKDLRDQGFTVIASDIKRICFEYCDSNRIPNQFNQEKRMASDDWYYGFLKRRPDIRASMPGRRKSTSPASSIASSALIEYCDESPKSKKLKLTPPQEGRNQKQDDIEEVMQTEKANEDNEDEEERDEEEDVERSAQLEKEDEEHEVEDEVEMDEDEEEHDEEEDVERSAQLDKEDEKQEVKDEMDMDEDDEEQDKFDKSDSDEEENEEGVPDDDDDEEGELVEQEDADEDEEERKKMKMEPTVTVRKKMIPILARRKSKKMKRETRTRKMTMMRMGP